MILNKLESEKSEEALSYRSGQMIFEKIFKMSIKFSGELNMQKHIENNSII